MIWDVLKASAFTFAPYSAGGDSGALFLAVSRKNPGVRYVIKSATPELACNEFMYSKIASLLGLHTQEAKLFKGIRGHKYAVGIRFSPNARKFRHDDADESNRRDFYAFQTLYVILNEEDSQEFFIDERERVFKLDNAAAFNIGAILAGATFTGAIPDKWMESKIESLIQSSLSHTEYDKYGIMLRILTERYGQEAGNVSLDMFKRFAAFDETALDEAYISLDVVYPERLSDYYREFIRNRKAECGRFLREKGMAIT